MIYKFIDNKGTFRVKNPHRYNLYFPLTNKDGSIFSSISPNLGGDIKADNEHFITPPASITDIKNNLLCRRNFFIKIDPIRKPKSKAFSNGASKKIIRASFPAKDTLEAGFLYHKIIKQTNLLRIEILNFIPADLAVEVMWVKVINKSNKEINIQPTSFIPLYGRSEKSLRDHRHVSSLLNRVYLDKYGILLKPTIIFDERGHKLNKTIYFCLGFQDEGIAPLGQFPTLEAFCGDGDLINPAAIEKNIKPFTKKEAKFDGKETVGALRFGDKKLKKGAGASYFLIIGADSASDKKGRQKIMHTFSKLNSPAKIMQAFEKTKKYWLTYLGQTNFDFKDKNFNNWLQWVKFQPTLRKLFGNSFLPHFDYGKGGRGWRDLWQDALTLLVSEQKRAKEIIINGFRGVRIDGSNATIITKDNRFISDRNRISRVWMDHGIWPYISIRLHINKTKDLELLNKDLPYFRDHLLKRAKEIDFGFNQKGYLLHTKEGGIYKGSILEHILLQHLTCFFNVGKHNIIRLENGDWNDGLDMAANKGESAAFSSMYAHNLRDMCFFLERLKKQKKTLSLLKEMSILLDQINKPINYNDFKAKQKVLEKYFEKTKSINGQKVEIKIDDLIYDLQKKSDHLFKWLQEKEWLKAGFFNGYYDNKARRVEGKSGQIIRMMLASQVFAIMSGVASCEQIKKTWTSIKKYLKDEKLGGFRLNSDFKSIYLDMGRAFGFSYGDKENGAFFSHMNVMLSNALYKQGFIKEGYEVINSIHKMATAKRAKIYPGIPEYFNNEGLGLYCYLTGSASWYIHTLIEEILGIKFILGDIVLEPKLNYLNFHKKNIDVSIPWAEKVIKISYIKGSANKPLKLKKVLLENKKMSTTNNTCTIERKLVERIKKKEVQLKVYLA